MAAKEPKSLFRRLTRLFRSGPVVKRKIRTADTAVAVADKTKSSGTMLFQKSLSPTYATITSNAYNLSERLMRYQDYQEMEYCLISTTCIPTVDGMVEIGELARRCSEDPAYTFIIYAYDHERKRIVPALGKQARQTRVDHAWKVTFDNGKSITASENHRLMLRDGSYCEVRDLQPGDAMMPFHRKDLFENAKEGTKGYSWVYTMDERFSGWTKEHQLIAEWVAGRPLADDEVVHHINFVKTDNRPENLRIMTKSDHDSYHAAINNNVKWAPENHEWIEEFKKNHAAWMRDNAPTQRRDVTFARILEMSEALNFDLISVCRALDVDRNVVYSRLADYGFARYETFVQAYRRVGPDGLMGSKRTVTVRELNLKEVFDVIEEQDTKQQLCLKLRCTVNVFNKFLDRKVGITWSALREMLGWKNESTRIGGRPKGSNGNSLTFQQICDAYTPDLTLPRLTEKLGVNKNTVISRLAQNGFKKYSEFQHSYENCKVVSVEYAGEMPLYDLTVDGYKNFATDSVISHNTPEIAAALDIYADETVASDDKGRILHVYSDNEKIKEILEDLFYNTLNVEFNLRSWVRNLPVHKDTVIPLLDGRNITIEQLAKEHVEGKENWVYSVQDGTHRIVPGKVNWCGLTRRDSELVRVWLDDGTYVDCTPDHEWVLRDGSQKKAEDLNEGESLMPFYRKESSRAQGNKMDGYEEIYDPRSDRYVYTHRRVAEVLEEGTLKEGRWLVTHHRDFDKRNNDPSNLVRMDEKEHMKLHQELAIARLHSPEVTARRMAGIDRWLRSDEHRKVAGVQLKKLQERGLMKTSWDDYNSSPQAKHDNVKRSRLKKEMWSDSDRRARAQANMAIKFDQRCVDLVVEALAAHGKYVSPKVLGNQLKTDETFMGHFKAINGNTARDLTKALNSHSGFENLLQKAGVPSYIDLVRVRLPKIAATPWFQRAEKKSARMSGIVPPMRNDHPSSKSTRLNHKVARVERLEQTSDVYCMEVLGPKGEHDRHNFAVVNAGGSVDNGTFVGNCKYGDFFMYNDVSPDYGVVNAFPIPVNEIEREENYDRDDPFAVRYRWVTLGNRTLENWEVSHFRLLGNDMFLPYGASIVEAARRIWRQLILIEDAMLVYRVVRAPERRVFYIDVANIPPENVPMYVEEQRKNLRTNSVVDNQTGRVDLRYNPLSVDEDYFIPVRGAETGTKIDTLAGGQNAAAVEDVAYIQKKLFAALKIPRAYLGYDELLSCLDQDTLIPTLSGKTYTISELAARDWSVDQNIWVYSADPNSGSFRPGRVKKAWKTKDVTELHVVTLDDGTVIKCTENHPFLCRDGIYRRADELQPGQSLMAQYVKKSTSKKNKGIDLLDGYQMLLDNSTNEWVYTHKAVSDHLNEGRVDRIGKQRVVHHVDCDKLNNDPSNLQEMTWHDHRRWHQQNLETTLLRSDVIARREPVRIAALRSQKHRDQKSAQMCAQHADKMSALSRWVNGDELGQKMSSIMRGRWQNDAYRKLKSEQNRTNWNDSAYRQKLCDSNHWIREKNSEYDIEWLVAFCLKHGVKSIKQWRSDHPNSVSTASPVGITYVNHLIDRSGYQTWRDFAAARLGTVVPKRGPDRGATGCTFTIDDLRRFCIERSVTTIGQWTKFHSRSVVGLSPVSGTVVKRLLRENGFKTFNDFVKTLEFNHKVVSVEVIKLTDPVPVYDLEVETWHNFAVTAGNDSFVYVHNSKATLAQEDIRFSRTIAVIQKTVLAELNKLAIIHLYAHGYDGEELQNFVLRLSNPSTVAQQQKLELWRAKFEIGASLPEGMGSAHLVQRDIWGMSEEEIELNNRYRLKEKQFNEQVEAGGAPAGGGEAGGADLFGGGGEEPEEEPEAAEPEETPPPETAGEEPEEEVEPDVSLLTSGDVENDEHFGIKMALKDSDHDRPIKAKNHLKHVMYNRGRRRTHGASKTHMPDYVKMTAADNKSLTDPSDSAFMKSIVSNPFGEATNRYPTRGVGLSPDMVLTLEKMSKSLLGRRIAAPAAVIVEDVQNLGEPSDTFDHGEVFTIDDEDE